MHFSRSHRQCGNFWLLETILKISIFNTMGKINYVFLFMVALFTFTGKFRNRKYFKCVTFVVSVIWIIYKLQQKCILALASNMLNVTSVCEMVMEMRKNRETKFVLSVWLSISEIISFNGPGVNSLYNSTPRLFHQFT